MSQTLDGCTMEGGRIQCYHPRLARQKRRSKVPRSYYLLSQYHQFLPRNSRRVCISFRANVPPQILAPYPPIALYANAVPTALNYLSTAVDHRTPR